MTLFSHNLLNKFKLAYHLYYAMHDDFNSHDFRTWYTLGVWVCKQNDEKFVND